MENIEIWCLYNKLKEIDDKELEKLILKILEENEKLRSEILIDGLTNIYNRKILNTNLNYDVLVMCDIDNFKEINDKYGHGEGDKLLKELATKLSSILRKDDLILRYGGDEFTILFRNCNVIDIKNKLLSFSNNYTYKDRPLTLSFGIAEYVEGKTLEETIEEADHALYISKEQGKNTITIYEPNNKRKILK